ncbi:MAG: hypothetical protein OXF48_04870 [Bacteroidetes bacterium]|nr:hypothetical protein [Bacteroidota bacterium]
MHTASKNLEVYLRDITVGNLLGKPPKKLWEDLPEPDYCAWDKYLATIENLAIIIGQAKGISKEELKSLSVKLFESVEKIDLYIEIVNALPESVAWRARADEKLIHLANRTEDVAEVCELALDEEFIKTIKDRIQKFVNASSDS